MQRIVCILLHTGIMVTFPSSYDNPAHINDKTHIDNSNETTHEAKATETKVPLKTFFEIAGNFVRSCPSYPQVDCMHYSFECQSVSLPII